MRRVRRNRLQQRGLRFVETIALLESKTKMQPGIGAVRRQRRRRLECDNRLIESAQHRQCCRQV